MFTKWEPHLSLQMVNRIQPILDDTLERRLIASNLFVHHGRMIFRSRTAKRKGYKVVMWTGHVITRGYRPNSFENERYARCSIIVFHDSLSGEEHSFAPPIHRMAKVKVHLEVILVPKFRN